MAAIADAASILEKKRVAIYQSIEAEKPKRAMKAANALWALYSKGSLDGDAKKICENFLIGYWDSPRSKVGRKTLPTKITN